VETDCTSLNSIGSAICLAKIIKSGGDCAKFLQKQVGKFFWATLYNY